ncbi:hypothetical protein [Streptomyces sp. NPDC058295]|uniref:hypothetical protein n=1 Tax=Streptomyces sp. NPDC058295 TaxID=3346431 RepID=UPI0036E9E8BC
MSGNQGRRQSEGTPRPGSRSNNRRATAQLRDRAVREFNAATQRGLAGVPVGEETQPVFVQFLHGGLNELMAVSDPEARLPEATHNLEGFASNLAVETRRRSLATVTLAVFTAIREHTCPLWPFC